MRLCHEYPSYFPFYPPYMSRILLHTLVFPPDGVSTATILSELMQDLHAAGHEIVVLTTRPHYNRDRDAEARHPLQKRLGGFYAVSDHHGIRVVHTWMPHKRQGTTGRLYHFSYPQSVHF